jgi:hypothetical protein
MEWAIPLIFAITAALAVNAHQCEEERYQRCTLIYGNLCDDPGEYVRLTKEWECP